MVARLLIRLQFRHPSKIIGVGDICKGAANTLKAAKKICKKKEKKISKFFRPMASKGLPP